MEQAEVLDTIAFARRQSPDWAALAADYRAGIHVDSARFVPTDDIPGFPPRIDRIVGAWNDRFAIDFFTCRALISALSQRSVAAVRGAAAFRYDEHEAIRALAQRATFVLFFHDDDDFFAPNVLERLAATTAWQADTCVFPLFRVHTDLFTFVRDGHAAEYAWGRRQSFHYRFQSNNYGINSRICSVEVLRAMKDHVLASRYADAVKLSESVCAFPISATVKTPCAASIVAGLLTDEVRFTRQMAAFAERFRAPELPDAYAWLREPLSVIARLFGAVVAGHGYAALPEILIG